MGSSGSLLMDSMGDEIDDHDAIFRFNNAPVGKELSQYVGSKTSFMYLNKAAMAVSEEACCTCEKGVSLVLKEASVASIMQALSSESSTADLIERWMNMGLRYIVLNYSSRFYTRQFKDLARVLEACQAAWPPHTHYVGCRRTQINRAPRGCTPAGQ